MAFTNPSIAVPVTAVPRPVSFWERILFVVPLTVLVAYCVISRLLVSTAAQDLRPPVGSVEGKAAESARRFCGAILGSEGRITELTRTSRWWAIHYVTASGEYALHQDAAGRTLIMTRVQPAYAESPVPFGVSREKAIHRLAFIARFQEDIPQNVFAKRIQSGPLRFWQIFCRTRSREGVSRLYRCHINGDSGDIEYLSVH